MAREPLGLVQGTVDVLILKTLTWAPMHGYGIAQWIRQRTEGALAVEDAALYQAKHDGRNRVRIAPSASASRSPASRWS